VIICYKFLINNKTVKITLKLQKKILIFINLIKGKPGSYVPQSSYPGSAYPGTPGIEI